MPFGRRAYSGCAALPGGLMSQAPWELTRDLKRTPF